MEALVTQSLSPSRLSVAYSALILSNMLVFALLATAIGLQKDPAPSVFERHSAEISKAGIVEFEGWIFSSATHRYLGSSTNAEAVAIEVAKTAADARLISVSLDIAKGKPAHIGVKIERDCRERVALAMRQKLEADGLTTITEDAGAGSATAVRALPVDSLKKKPLDWNQAMSLIEEHASSADDYALLCEVNSSLNSTEASKNRFNEAIKAKYAVIPGWRSTPISDGWYSLGYPISEQHLERLSIDDLFQLLARRPFDPVVTRCIAKRLKDAERAMAADAVLLWPTISWREDPEIDKQLEQLEKVLPPEKAAKRIGILRVLAHAGGSWPIAKVDLSSSPVLIAFQEGRVAEALGGFIDELGRSPSADAANYVAACLLALKNPYCASCFSNLAMMWEPNHPYAAGNLMLSKQSLGNAEEAHVLAKSILENPNSSAWAKVKANATVNAEQKK